MWSVETLAAKELVAIVAISQLRPKHLLLALLACFGELLPVPSLLLFALLLWWLLVHVWLRLDILAPLPMVP